VEEIYRDWIIPDMKKEITGGKQFLATLTSEELMWMREQLIENYVSNVQTEMVLSGNLPPNGMTFEEHKEMLKGEAMKKIAGKGNKQLLEIVKDEFRDIEVKMGIAVGNKQKNLADLSDKVLSIFQFVFQNPQAFTQAMQNPALSRAFENILEFSGMSIADFSSLITATPPVVPPALPPASAGAGETSAPLTIPVAGAEV
jgi:hypothetical protein